MAISGADRVALAGAEVADHSDEEARAVAAAFAREFARLRYPGPRIMRLFADPFYGRAHAAFRRLGERAVGEIVAAVVRESRPVRRAR
jgi:hypothetical protein